MRFGLVADDLTGGCDSASPLVAAGRVLVSIWPNLPTGDDFCPAVSTESRHATTDESYRRSRLTTEAIKRSGVDVLFRKVDSQLRGNVAADIGGTLAAWPGACVIAPALPEEGRITSGGWQRWAGGEIDLVALLLRGGLRAKLGSPTTAEPGLIVVCDAATSEELDAIAAEIARSDVEILPAGAASLAARLPAAFGCPAVTNAVWPRCRRPVAVIGTPSAAKQAEYAAKVGKAVFVLGPDELPHNLGDFDGLFVTGGETASRVLSWLGVEKIEILGEVLPRVPVGVCRGGPHDGLPVAMKSGAFGPVDAIARALDGLALLA